MGPAALVCVAGEAMAGKLCRLAADGAVGHLQRNLRSLNAFWTAHRAQLRRCIVCIVAGGAGGLVRLDTARHMRKAVSGDDRCGGGGGGGGSGCCGGGVRCAVCLCRLAWLSSRGVCWVPDCSGDFLWMT
jgi:hypothetical protein